MENFYLGLDCGPTQSYLFTPVSVGELHDQEGFPLKYLVLNVSQVLQGPREGLEKMGFSSEEGGGQKLKIFYEENMYC